MYTQGHLRTARVLQNKFNEQISITLYMVPILDKILHVWL